MPSDRIQQELVVSVCMITYNHAQYIRQAIESVLVQKTSFRFELVIGEDCSTDPTAEIVSELGADHSDIIRVLPNRGRLGMTSNFERTLTACTGRYVAFLEGDDYWTCPQKLQRQFDFLEGHREYSLSFHQVRVVRGNGSGGPDRIPYFPVAERTTIQDLLQKNYIHVASLFARNPCFTRFPDWIRESPLPDWALSAALAMTGDIHYLPEPMAVYRSTGTGVWSALPGCEQNERVYKTQAVLDRGLGYRYTALIRPRLLQGHWALAREYTRQGKRTKAAKQACLYFERCPPFANLKMKMGLLLTVLSPSAYRGLHKLHAQFLSRSGPETDIQVVKR